MYKHFQMKKAFILFMVAMLPILAVSCHKNQEGSSMNGAVKNADNGTALQITELSAKNTSEYGGSIYLTLSAKEGTVPIWLSMFISPDAKVGETLSFNNIHFGIPISSNSEDYTDEFTGRMTLAGKDSKSVSVEMKNTAFKIAHGTYTFDGTFVFGYK